MQSVPVVAAIVASLGCGSSGADEGGRRMTWKEDGVSVSALGTTSKLKTNAGRDYLTLTGTDFHVGIGLAIAVPTPLSPDTFICGQTASDQLLSISYSAANDDTLTETQSCAFVITQVGSVGGPPAVGTFEAVFKVPSGGTKSIANGSFSLPLTM